jgi:hypothetical protein
MEERRRKAVENRDKAKRLQEICNIDVVQSRYRETGDWYALLERFPAALFDANGYLIINSEEEYRSSLYLKKGKELSINKPGISAIPGYVRFHCHVLEQDIDIHELSVSEGNSIFVAHIRHERNQTIIKAKKRHAKSLDCEICGFSLVRVYGANAKDYCEVHHLIQLSEAERETETYIKALAILCSNCHRVVHLRNPPFSLNEVKCMLTINGATKR